MLLRRFVFAIMSSKKASVEIIYPKSWGQRLLSVAGVVASYLFVATVAFWAGTRVGDDPALKNFFETSSALAAALHQTAEPATRPVVAKTPEQEAVPDWTEKSADGLAIAHALASLGANPGNQISYDLTLVNKGRRFTGSMEILVAGSTPTGNTTHTYKKPGSPDKDGKNELMSVGRFLHTRGEFPLPANFTPRLVFVKLVEEGEVRASKVLQMSPGNGHQPAAQNR